MKHEKALPSKGHQRKAAQLDLYQHVTYQHGEYQPQTQNIQPNLCFWISWLPSEMIRVDNRSTKKWNGYKCITKNEAYEFLALTKENCGCVSFLKSSTSSFLRASSICWILNFIINKILWTVQCNDMQRMAFHNLMFIEVSLSWEEKKKKEPFLTPGSIRKQIYYDKIKLVAY